LNRARWAARVDASPMEGFDPAALDALLA